MSITVLINKFNEGHLYAASLHLKAAGLSSCADQLDQDNETYVLKSSDTLLCDDNKRDDECGDECDYEGYDESHIHELIANAIKAGSSVTVECLDDEPCHVLTAKDYAETYTDELPFWIEKEIARKHGVSSVVTVNHLPRWIEEYLED